MSGVRAYASLVDKRQQQKKEEEEEIGRKKNPSL